MFLIVIAALAAIWLAIKLGRALSNRKRLTSKFDQLPGGTPNPIHPIFDILNTMLIDRVSIKQKRINGFVRLYELALGQCKLFQDVGLFRWYLGTKPVVFLFSPENVESLLQSPTVLNKADEYRVFEPWLGEGLVTSKRAKWKVRRKLLTPAFHFRILNDFLPTMNEEASKLVRKLNNVKYSRSFNVVPVVALCTLDTICETAMGVNINCQATEESDYVKALCELGEISLKRVIRPWLWADFIFERTALGHRYAQASKCMHDFTRTVILNRKNEWEQLLTAAGEKRATSDEAPIGNNLLNVIKRTYSKPSDQPRTISSSESGMEEATFEDPLSSSGWTTTKRLAFLDLLLQQHLVENSMSLEDIREEVDTFMFAGHDTTAMNISWALYLLGLHADVQERVRCELDDVLSPVGDEDEFEPVDNDADNAPNCRTQMNDKLKLADITVEHLARLKYLDMVIKEALRMFPSIPFVARQMTEDVLVGGKYLVPKGATGIIFLHALQNNSKVFPRAELFDPDRFLPENVNKRHPFAYTPFSAGARNCIGQKFAKMEVKIILAKIIRNYRIESTLERDRLKLVGELVLRSTEGLPIRLKARFRPSSL